jgi:hypothetical protein
MVATASPSWAAPRRARAATVLRNMSILRADVHDRHEPASTEAASYTTTNTVFDDAM